MRSARSHPIPIADADIPQVRLQLFGVIVGLLLILLIARLWYLQVVDGEVYREKAEANRTKKMRTAAPRGIIEDSEGRALVTNSAQFTVFVNPLELPKDKTERTAVLARLAEILELTPERLQEIMKRNKVGASGPIPVAEGISQHVLARISERRMLLPGVEPDVEPVRKYPMGDMAAHVLGYIGEITDKQLDDPEAKKRYRPGDLIGQSGLERKYDQLLNGIKGITYYEVDAKGRQQNEKGHEEPRPGATLRLSLNAAVQRAAEEGLNGKKGAAVALDPQTGAVIALASAPRFDPNLLARRPLSHAVYKDKIQPGEFHRAIQAQAPPGSTFKIVTSAAVLATETVGRDTTYFCGGAMQIGRGSKPKHCHKFHGSVTLRDALAASCDIYYYRSSMRMGIEPLDDWARRFGLGKRLGIDLPGEAKGVVPSPARKRRMAKILKSPDTEWYSGDTANVSIGQGDVQVTPLQMATVVGAIANGGTVYAPHIVQQATDSITQKVVYQSEPKVINRLGLSQEQIRAIAEGLRQCVAGSRGTAHSINLKNVTVAGKTGSAEKRGGSKKESHAWFVCYAPYEKPRIAIAIFLESEGQNYHGGTDAAPIARKMMAKYFHISEEVSNGQGVIAD